MGFFDKLGASLKKTRDSIFETIGRMVTASAITDDMYDDLEEQLILADTGVEMCIRDRPMVSKMESRVFFRLAPNLSKKPIVNLRS